eukprot:89115_1
MKQQKLNTKKTIQKFGAAAGATIGGVAMYTGFVPVGVAVWGATGVLYTVMRRKISDEATKLDQDWEMISKPPITDDDDDDKKDWEMNIDDDDDDKKDWEMNIDDDDDDKKEEDKKQEDKTEENKEDISVDDVNEKARTSLLTVDASVVKEKRKS